MSDFNKSFKSWWAESQSIWTEERIRNIELSNHNHSRHNDLFTWKQRLLAVPILGSFIHWCWLLLRLRIWLPELLDMRVRVSKYELVIRDQLLAGLSRNARDELTYKHQLPDSVRLSLEESLRVNEAEIFLKRFSYIPRVQLVASGLKLPVIDVGCGRGDWLAKLALLGIEAYGVDIDESVVKINQDRGLDVICEDGSRYLLSLNPGSLSAITFFQVIEHLPLPEVWTMLGAAYRALAPGGLIIFQTPNPENLQIASRSVRFDLGGGKFLSPKVLTVLVNQSGFGGVEIQRFNPCPELMLANGQDLMHFHQLLFCERDYILCAYKQVQ